VNCAAKPGSVIARQQAQYQSFPSVEKIARLCISTKLNKDPMLLLKEK
jgi:hypothetical protein